jgi:hypothetical protein
VIEYCGPSDETKNRGPVFQHVWYKNIPLCSTAMDFEHIIITHVMIIIIIIIVIIID